MRIVVTGATGNVGTSLIASLVADPRVTEIVGRRAPRCRGWRRRAPRGWQPTSGPPR